MLFEKTGEGEVFQGEEVTKKDTALNHKVFAHQSLVCPKYCDRHGDHYYYFVFSFLSYKENKQKHKTIATDLMER